MLAEESKWLFDGIAKVVIQSERMKLYYDYTEKLIRKNAAYICTCSSEKFKKFADFKENCPCRNNDLKENLYKWKKMLDKTKNGYKEGDAVVRFKSDMKHKNPAMRDFPLARINLTPHPLQGKKYKVWPLMNLAVTVDDIEMKMTHIIRAKDHRDNAERQKMIFEVLNKKYPWSAFLGRIHFKDLELSTSQFRKAIEEKKYSGWDDKRLPTIASLKKQGYKPQAFWKFAEQVGLSESDKVIDKAEYFKLLDSFNRQ
jgi:glutamyl-tRNA synthetase